jgi:CarD family transcriptional regulator
VAFEIGDKVIYPNHGLGIVERIETKTIMGTTCGFYQLRMANETTVFVPVDNVDGVGLRRAITDTEVERLFELLGDGQIESHQNWKGRFKDNSDRMRTGSIYDVVEVLKSLTFLSKSKSLSFREKRMLDRAKFLVVSEITEVLAEKTPQVEDKVEKALERCFATKARNAAKAKANPPVKTAVAAPAPPPVFAPPVAVAPPKAAVPPAKMPVAASKPPAPTAKVDVAPPKVAAKAVAPKAVAAKGAAARPNGAAARTNGSTARPAAAAARPAARPASAPARAAAKPARAAARVTAARRARAS